VAVESGPCFTPVIGLDPVSSFSQRCAILVGPRVCWPVDQSFRFAPYLIDQVSLSLRCELLFRRLSFFPAAQIGPVVGADVPM